ncbi:uracil-DNA glycosylase [Candidatus Poribacteria bacterium]|nr:MAG: uracil-DNA glycosylase [Candidatus Poribacteria bacterium]
MNDKLKEALEEYLSIIRDLRSHLLDLKEAGFAEVRSPIPDEEPAKGNVELLDKHRIIAIETKPQKPSGSISAIPTSPLLFSGIAPASIFAAHDMEGLKREVLNCKRCPLWRERTNVVFGDGDENADLMFIGEAPGEEEDLQGIPFVGRAGGKLNEMLQKVGISREEVYITNVVKCHPPRNRDPQPSEIDACEPFLIRQIELIKPKLICALGRHAANTLLKTRSSLGRLRGKFYDFHGIKLFVTYHPAFILRNPGLEDRMLADFRRLKAEYDRLRSE